MVRNLPLTRAEIELDDLGEGSPILLLHGFPATRRLWSQVAPVLAEIRYRVIVPDLVGYGASRAKDEARVDMVSQARWLWELLDTLRIDRPTIVAHDVGSAAAQLMVASAPTRARGLAILDGVYRTEWAMDAVESIRAWDVSNAERLIPVLTRRLGKSPGMKEILTAYAGEEGGKRLIRAARDLDPSQTADIGDSLRKAAVPYLVLWGKDDRYLDIDTVGRPLAEMLNAPLTVLPGGHFTPLDCPEAVCDALLEFLGKCESA